MTFKGIRSLLRQNRTRKAKIVGPSSESNSKPWTPLGMDRETEVLWNKVRSRTMTSIERIDSLRQSVEYIQANSIPGAIVECGVWRGGSMMAAALTLMRLGATRSLWLYDTFSGMTPPGEDDKDFQGRSASELLKMGTPEANHIRARISLEEVKAGMREINYPDQLIRYVSGPVESTIPQHVPDKIALLRLDTDWFQSTYHELIHLWGLISIRGVLIVDDYGYWAGAKKAVDRFFQEIGAHPFLHRIDFSGRLVIKQE